MVKKADDGGFGQMTRALPAAERGINMADFRVAVIGLGCRGKSLTELVLLKRDDVEITAVCDVYPDRVEDMIRKITETKPEHHPRGYADAKELFEAEADKLDAVLISSSWDYHNSQACMAMRYGVPAAVEVGGAYSERELWDLVETYEETGTPLMFLENCCYGREELMVLNMVKQGLFGDIVHCAGGYHHDLRDEVSGGLKNRHYRLDNYLCRNCENYPTHEIGPIAKVLNLNYGNRMMSLTSTASRAAGLEDYLARHEEEFPGVAGRHFNQGDIVTTVIRCAMGQTITLTLDTTLPRYYSRGFTVRGTRGMYFEDNHSIFLDDNEEHKKADFEWRPQWGNADQYRDEYEHPIWREFLASGLKGGHGGMDWLVFDAFFKALKEKKPMPIDVYDAASWMAISLLSEESIALGSQPVAFPDFTRGQWMKRRPQE